MHLQFSFAGLGALGKNIQDQRGAVNNLYPDDFFQVFGLRPGHFVVHDHQIRFPGLGLQLKLIGFSAAHKGGRIRLGPLLEIPSDHHGTGAFRQGFQLIQGFFAVDAHQDSAFRRIGQILVAALQHPLLGQTDLVHPLLLRQLFQRINIAEFHTGHAVYLFRQESGADAGDPPRRVDPHGAHAVQHQGAQRRNIHIAQVRRTVGMGVDAPDEGQPFAVPPQAHVLQRNAVAHAHRHIQHVAIPADIHRNFPVQSARMPRKLRQQLTRRKFIRFKGAVVKRFDLLQLRFTNPLGVAMYFRHSVSLFRPEAITGRSLPRDGFSNNPPPPRGWLPPPAASSAFSPAAARPALPPRPCWSAAALP